MSENGLRVLLADDDPAIHRILSKWLEKAGYEVSLARDGHEALAAVEAHCPEFVITDWDMPVVNGLDLCRQIREMTLPHYVYVLFLTVKSSQADMLEGLEVGADDFLTKPVHQAELLARMRAASRVVRLERRLSQMARTDSLTGLLTQRTFYGLLDKEWRRAKRYDLPLSCVMLDIDFFKRINDQHGHPAGDAVLKAVSELLADSVRGSDSVCRYGGEEFCVLLPETTESQAALWAERARANISKLGICVGNKQLSVTGSFGVAQRRDDTQTCEALVDLADQGLLCAKQSGRDRVVAYESLCHADEVDLTAPDKYSGLFRGIAARHVMTPMVFCLEQDETVGNAVEFFLRSRINSTPVVGSDGKLAGMLSEKDLMSAMVSPDCWGTAVKTVMRPHVICYDEDTPIRTVYEFLCRVSIRRVVITENDRPVGTISRSTLLRWFRNMVVSQGLVKGIEGADVPQSPNALDVQRSKQRLAETARELAHHASRLEQRFQHDAEDLVPFVVGGATQMQELVTDLLAFSRYANEPATGAFSIDASQFESTHLD